ncbi:anamorsin [Artemisia annua]|uniref:Anamorsin n=1 Tax=Artemisia annua TaxID=35608 RepID=A0A2U1KMI6_ARTAN|nr:anamorsin [Artemisia annua]
MAELQSFGIKAKKPTWKFGSSFFLKKTVKSLPKVLIDDDMDLIDEDNLLLKPQLPPECFPWLVDEKGAFTAKGGHDKDSKCFPMLYMPQDLLTVVRMLL